MTLTAAQQSALVRIGAKRFPSSFDGISSQTMVALRSRGLIRAVDRFPSGAVTYTITREGLRWIADHTGVQA